MDASKTRQSGILIVIEPIRNPIKQIDHDPICQSRQVHEGLPVLSAGQTVQSLQNSRQTQLVRIDLHVFSMLKKEKIILGHQVGHPGYRLLIGLWVGVTRLDPENAHSDHEQNRNCSQHFRGNFLKYLFFI